MWCAGPKGELALLPAFAELAILLPEHKLDIHFVGPDVPEQLHKQECRVALGVQQRHGGVQQQEATKGREHAWPPVCGGHHRQETALLCRAVKR